MLLLWLVSVHLWCCREVCYSLAQPWKLQSSDFGCQMLGVMWSQKFSDSWIWVLLVVHDLIISRNGVSSSSSPFNADQYKHFQTLDVVFLLSWRPYETMTENITILSLVNTQNTLIGSERFVFIIISLSWGASASQQFFFMSSLLETGRKFSHPREKNHVRLEGMHELDENSAW